MSESQLGLLWDSRRAKAQGAEAIVLRQRSRLADTVAFARAHSPYYRELYQRLPDRIEDPTLLPVSSKRTLMAHFDDWATDREVTSEGVRAFVEDPALIGEPFLGKYQVVTTSGTTGAQGIFLIDERSLTVTNAMAFRMMSAWLGFADVIRILLGRGKLAMVNATGGHFASAVAGVRLRRRRPDAVQVFPVEMPLAQMVAELNEFGPVVLAAYASIGALLASEREAGRLKINPVLLVLSAEGLPAREYQRVSKAFGVRARDSYAASECPFLSYRCDEGWLHVNNDWAILEPVDAAHRPVKPGEQSHTVLLSNLANRLQPILRYDLGDSILERTDPCPCGNPMQAIVVQGRAAEVLTFATAGGESVAVAPLTFGTAVDLVAGVEQFQLVQTGSTKLRVRLRLAGGAEPEAVWQAVLSALTRLLAEQNLGHVALERAAEAPAQTPGGKHRTVIPLKVQP